MSIRTKVLMSITSNLPTSTQILNALALGQPLQVEQTILILRNTTTKPEAPRGQITISAQTTLPGRDALEEVEVVLSGWDGNSFATLEVMGEDKGPAKPPGLAGTLEWPDRDGAPNIAPAPADPDRSGDDISAGLGRSRPR